MKYVLNFVGRCLSHHAHSIANADELLVWIKQYGVLFLWYKSKFLLILCHVAFVGLDLTPLDRTRKMCWASLLLEPHIPVEVEWHIFQ
ncbi:hypothetical protein TNCV_2196401 [Trichonephila clavipes]|nr:hypothetical protein TNCV_2196401 [Trichonephila clavipes]